MEKVKGQGQICLILFNTQNHVRLPRETPSKSDLRFSSYQQYWKKLS